MKMLNKNCQVVKVEKVSSVLPLPLLASRRECNFPKLCMAKIQLPALGILSAYVDTPTDMAKISYTLSPPDGIVAVSGSFTTCQC